MHIVGHVSYADTATARLALDHADAFFPSWNATPVATRAGSLRAAADLLEQNRNELVALCVSEAGRSIPDALDEIREAVDFLRYYAAQGETLCGEALELKGPTINGVH